MRERAGGGTRVGVAIVVMGATLCATLCATRLAVAEPWLALRGAYYKERATRVVQPMLDAHLEPTAGSAIDAHLLVDTITSASASTGSMIEFTERRWELGLAWLTEVGRRARAGLSTKVSQEGDYSSFFGAVRGELEFAERNTTVVLVVGRGFDEITNGVATGEGAIGTPRQTEALSTGLTSIGVTQLLGRRLIGTLTYDFIDLHGFQANIYRVVRVGETRAPETVPELRLRHALHAGLRAYVPATRSVLAVGYRFYVDDWGIVAHTPQLRISQELAHGLELRASYRFHSQGAADFFADQYGQEEVDAALAGRGFVVDDEKLSAHRTHVLRGQLELALARFGATGRIGEMRVDVVVERIVQETAFGNAWAAQVGLWVPLDE